MVWDCIRVTAFPASGDYFPHERFIVTECLVVPVGGCVSAEQDIEPGAVMRNDHIQSEIADDFIETVVEPMFHLPETLVKSGLFRLFEKRQTGHDRNNV